MSITNSKLTKNYPSRQKKYRKTQQQKGLIRYEIQVNQEVKNRFEEAVAVVANEYTLPYSEKARKAKARAQIFDEQTKGTVHKFQALEAKLKAEQAKNKVLEEKIRAISPSFFMTDISENIALPDAIAATNDPKKLKILLSQIFNELRKYKSDAAHYERLMNNFEGLHKLAVKENETLKLKLNHIKSGN